MKYEMGKAVNQDNSDKSAKRSSETRKEMNIHGLPKGGCSRWGDIKHMIPVSHEKWAQMAKCGQGPPITRFGARCSFQSNDEIMAWLADPLNYRAKVKNIDFHSTFEGKS